MKPAADTHLRTRASASGTTTTLGYVSIFPGRADQVGLVRREIAAYLTDCPAADDIVLIASELAGNAIMHTQSRGSSFIARCQLSPGAARIEVEDRGGPWRQRTSDDRPHELDIIQALAGPDGWGTQVTETGGRIVWAQLTW